MQRAQQAGDYARASELQSGFCRSWRAQIRDEEAPCPRAEGARMLKEEVTKKTSPMSSAAGRTSL